MSIELLKKSEANKIKNSKHLSMDLSLYGTMVWDEFNIDDIHMLLQDNRKKFKKLFGPPHYTNKCEFYYRNWIFKFQSEYICVYTAETKGTGFDILNKVYGQLPSPEFSKEFYKLFIELVRKPK